MAAVIAALIIVLAIAVGAFRLLLPQLPAYQGQIQAWAEGALGMPVRFSRMDARWGLQGPELTFFDALIGEADTQTGALLAAAEVRVGVGVLALITSQKLSVDRVTLVDSSLDVERVAAGHYRVQGVDFERPDGTPGVRAPGVRVEQFPNFEIVIEASEVSFSDQLRGGTTWHFTDLEIELQRSGRRLALEVQAVPPELLGGPIEFAATAELESDGSMELLDLPWQAFLNLRDADLAGWSRLLADFDQTPDEGRGDISLWLGIVDRQPVQGTIQASISDLVLPGQRLSLDNGHPYEQFRLMAEWERAGDTWRVSATDLSIKRQDRWWPRGELDMVLSTGTAGFARLEFKGDFLRLEDLTPWQVFVPQGNFRERWAAFDPRGDLQPFSMLLERQPDDLWHYAGEARASGITVKATEDLPGFREITADFRIDSTSGRIALDTSSGQLAWPSMLASTVPVDRLEGVIVWRQSRDGLRIVGDDLVMSNSDLTSRSSFELSLPADGSSPILDLDTGVADINIVALKRYLPENRMKPGVYDWMRRAWEQGRIPRAQVSFFGPLDGFPFEDGNGQFRVVADIEDVRLRFVKSWPAAEELSAQVVIDNAALDARITGGRILGNIAREGRVRFRDIRNGRIEVDTTTSGPVQELLNFLDAAPIIAERLNPGLESVHSPSGDITVNLDLMVPLLDRSRYELQVVGELNDATLVVAGLNPPLTAINGKVTLDQTVIGGKDLEAVFLDAATMIALGPADVPGFHTVLQAQGVANAEQVIEAFPFPIVSELDGVLGYGAEVLFPFGEQKRPLEVRVTSDFRGLALQMPPPLAIAVDEAAALELKVVLQSRKLVQLSGQLDDRRQFALQLQDQGQGLSFQRGSLQFGAGGQPSLPVVDGLVIFGDVSRLRVDDWLDRIANTDESLRMEGLLRSVRLTAEETLVFGQGLGASTLAMDRSGNEWLVQLDSANVVGAVFVPFELASRPQITMQMERLVLTEAVEPHGASDPRQLPGFDINADEFVLDGRQFGTLVADIRPDPRGLRAVSFVTEQEAFNVQGDGSWLVETDGARTRANVKLSSSDVGATLVPLGFDRLMEAKQGEIGAEVSWDGSPTSGWMRTVDGRVTVGADNGALNEIEPGAGRVFGLMSIVALPRRLALDFRDVFNKGLSFDSLTGSYTLVDGDAYTNDLKFDGPAAEIGIVGRTGLKARDYQQQAIVTAKVSRTLPAVGGILAGPGVGAALLLFTEIFRGPLKGIGQASYCVTGSWDEPQVDRLTPAQLQDSALCADLLPNETTANNVVVGGGPL
jgi:uncharacterized protein (TIGR02099 family)